MSKDVNEKLEARRKVIEAEFARLANERNAIIEQGKSLNKRLSQIQTRQAQLQGSFAEIKELLGEEPVAKPKKKASK